MKNDSGYNLNNGPVISVEGLSKQFDSIEALCGVSFEVARGEIFGVLGPDGAGKTTLMRILAGLMDYPAGSVRVAGFDLKTEQPGLSDLIAYMPQRFGLYEDLTVMENILFYADLYDMQRGAALDARIGELLEFCRMAPFKNRLAGRLSGGMKQKLGLTCALIHTPELLLLDEPTNGVDPVSRREFWKILNEMRKSGLTIFVSTTYLDEAERCNNIAFINRGRIGSISTPQLLKKSSQNLLWRLEVSDKFRAVEVFKNIEEIISALVMGPAIHIFTKKDCAKDAVEKIVKNALAPLGIELNSIGGCEPNLEDIFIERMS
jgi:ABC-2 type transport system ATP-binding protein